MAKEPATPPSVAPAAKPLPIAIIPQDGFNLQIEEQLDPYNVIVKLVPSVHNWFAGTFTNLPTDKEVTIGLSMAGNDTKGNEGNVKKWEGLHPVFTYADPARYETYEWFQKDARGRWVSGDIFKQGETKYAGTGMVPIQAVIPPKIAEQFLSTDGTYWSAWRDIESTESVGTFNIFRWKQKYGLPQATVAMRIPFTYTYLQSFIGKLQAAKLPGVFVDEAGTTPEGRKLQIIRVEDETSTAKPENRDTVLVYAREHASEQASSLVLLGALFRLLEKTPEAKHIRKDTTWLLIPILDPDGSYHALHNPLTNEFHLGEPGYKIRPEIQAYCRYLMSYASEFRTIDLTIALHNVETNECENLFCPFLDINQVESTKAFNSKLYTALQEEGFVTGNLENYWATGELPFRLSGWCAQTFNTADIAYEVNDRYPANRLSMVRLQQMGAIIARQAKVFISENDGKVWHFKALEALFKAGILLPSHQHTVGDQR